MIVPSAPLKIGEFHVNAKRKYLSLTMDNERKAETEDHVKQVWVSEENGPR